MSLRNFVPQYPMTVNGPPPHHQPHRVGTIPGVNLAAVQQQISQQAAAAQQQQQQQQQQTQGNAQTTQNSGGNVQAAPTHEYMPSCLPYQTPAGPNLTQNFIRHMPNGGYAPAHPPNPAIFQTQGGPPGVVQNQQPSQPNSAQPLSNQQNPARLTPMTQPTAPPTPPNQQQQQPQQAPYAVQMQAQQGMQTGGAGVNPRAQQYRAQGQVPRRQPQFNPQHYQIYQQIPSQYGVPIMLPPGAHVRAPAYSSFVYQPQVFGNYAAATPGFGQIGAPSNGQQRQSTPQATIQTMAPAQANEYSGYTNMEVYQPQMQQPQVSTQAPPQPPQKTVKKPGSKAIAIINPISGKSIFDDDASASSTGGASGGGGAGSSIATVDKAITASHNELNKDEAGDKEGSSSSSTPVVSAMSDGPSVDITPKHTVNKNKKVKPPEPMATPQITPAPVPSEPLPTKQPKQEVETEQVAQIPRDNENNTVPITVPREPEVVEAEPVAVASIDVDDTTNGNYQNDSKPESDDEDNLPVARETEVNPQDSKNNNPTDESLTTSPSIRQNASPAPEPVPVPNEKPVPQKKISIIDYAPDQWSPENLDGRKSYTRDQLLKLKDQPIVTQKPFAKFPEAVLNALVKDNTDTLSNTLTQTLPLPNMGGGGSMQRGAYDIINAVTPKFMANQMGNRNAYPKRPSQQGNKQQVPNSGRGSQAGIIKLTLSLQDDIKLNEAQNAWKPSHLAKKPELTEEERATQDLLSRFRSMLNKLTAENFRELVDQVKQFKIDSSDRLDGVISLVFEKAISEPKFAPTYANLCKEISHITTATQGEAQGKKNTLKTKLITQCQKEFERHREESIVFNEIEEKLREIENNPEPEKREEEKAQLEEEHYKVRQRANGTVKFIGELFKIEMLTSKIMRACIDMLLQEVTEEKIERVCKLLTTIGAKLESFDGPNSLDPYFQKLGEMLHPNHKIIKSSRIKFEIQNLEDLRNNRWKPRRVDLTPRTMDQIQKEADQEQQKQQMINYQTRQNAKEDRQRGGQGGYGGGRRTQQDNDGWSVQGNNRNSRAVPPIQFKNFNLPMVNSDGPKLGQPADFKNFMTQTNKFSVLPIDTPDNDMPQRFGGSKNSSMERGGDRNSRNYYPNGSSDSRSDGRYSGRNSSSNQGSRNSSQIRSRDNSSGPGGPSRSLQPPPRMQQPLPSSNMSFSGALQKTLQQKSPPPEPMSREDVDKNFKAMLAVCDAYREDKLTLEMASKKLMPLSINKDVMVEIYNKFLDHKHRDRDQLMQLICELLKTKKLSRDDNKAALIDTMELAPDMACDVPRVYEYIAQFIAELLVASHITFQDVLEICDNEIKSNGNGEKLLSYILESVDSGHGALKLKQTVTESKCDLGLFVNGNFSRWLETSKFADKVLHGKKGKDDVIPYVKQLLNQRQSAEVIIEYIKSSKCTIDASFIRDLTVSVLEHCWEETPRSESAYKLNNNRLADLSTLLLCFIDRNRDLELQCICATQGYAHNREYPPGLLSQTFEILYDNDVLSSEAFETWKNSESPTEGKGVAICSLRQFFTRLDEEMDDDDGDYADEGETS